MHHVDLSGKLEFGMKLTISVKPPWWSGGCSHTRDNTYPHPVQKLRGQNSEGSSLLHTHTALLRLVPRCHHASVCAAPQGAQHGGKRGLCNAGFKMDNQKKELEANLFLSCCYWWRGGDWSWSRQLYGFCEICCSSELPSSFLNLRYCTKCRGGGEPILGVSAAWHWL